MILAGMCKRYRLARISLAFAFLSATMHGYGQTIPEPFMAADKYASLAEIKYWANRKEVRGFGYPESIEFTSAMSAHVFVTWNDPYSGRAAVYSNAFVRARDGKTWERVDASLFESPDPLAFAYVNPRSGALIFVGQSGATLKTLRLER